MPVDSLQKQVNGHQGLVHETPAGGPGGPVVGGAPPAGSVASYNGA